MANKKKRLFKLLFFPISLLLCLSIFLINTFAYQSDRLSYTLTFNQTIGNINFYNINAPIPSTEDKSNYVLMINFNYNSQANNNVVVYWYWANGTTTITSRASTSNNRNINNNGLTTLIYKFGYYMGSQIVNSIGNEYSNGYTLNDVVNIDLVKLDEIWIGDYVDVYVNNYTSQLEQDIDDLQDRFDTLNDNYEQLESDYNTLNDNYEQLESDYNNLENASFEANGFYNNINTIAFNGDYNAINKDTAYNYLSRSYMDFFNLLEDNSIYENNNRTGRQNLEIYFINPINISNFKYHLEFNGLPAESGYPTDYYISFGNSNGQGKIEYLHDIETIIEIPNNFMCTYIDIFWWNSDVYSSWIDVMNASEYDLGFSEGLNQGYSSGYKGGYKYGYDEGQSFGQSEGYASGYQVGYNEGMETDLTTNGVKTLFNSILSFPVDMIKNVFNFDFMGVNVASVIMFIISIGIVAFVIKKFL